eukprot:scaffold1437_cov113-Cylindrotheca_fusiformis.AAC.3
MVWQGRENRRDIVMAYRAKDQRGTQFSSLEFSLGWRAVKMKTTDKQRPTLAYPVVFPSVGGS